MMGIIISRFWKQPTTLEQLKKIEDSLRKIEDYKKSTEQKQKRTVANLLIYGVALYILACVIVFVWYLPESWLVRLALLIPLVLVPLIMVRANEEYADLQKKKKSLIDSVMETETFNKAKEILTKYAPENLEKKETATYAGTVAMKNNTTDLRHRNSPSSNTSSKLQWLTPVDQEPFIKPSAMVMGKNIEPHPAKKSGSLVPFTHLSQPIFPKNRSLGDKLVEYIVGDGPSYRYALICKFCKEHNGMALQEEFPYLSFSCCYCRKLNPARISRPSAPRLPESENLRTLLKARSIMPSVTNKKSPTLVPLDQKESPQSQETDPDSTSVSPQVKRISDGIPNESLVEGERPDKTSTNPFESSEEEEEGYSNKDKNVQDSKKVESDSSLFGIIPIKESSHEETIGSKSEDGEHSKNPVKEQT